MLFHRPLFLTRFVVSCVFSWHCILLDSPKQELLFPSCWPPSTLYYISLSSNCCIYMHDRINENNIQFKRCCILLNITQWNCKQTTVTTGLHKQTGERPEGLVIITLRALLVPAFIVWNNSKQVQLLSWHTLISNFSSARKMFFYLHMSHNVDCLLP